MKGRKFTKDEELLQAFLRLANITISQIQQLKVVLQPKEAKALNRMETTLLRLSIDITNGDRC